MLHRIHRRRVRAQAEAQSLGLVLLSMSSSKRCAAVSGLIVTDARM
jgi:hypothetical protein